MADFFKEKTIIFIVLISLIFRLFLSSTTIHADTIAFSFAGKVVADGNVLDLYDYLYKLPVGDKILSIYPPNLFIYPPLPYFYFSLVNAFSNIFINDSFIMDVVYDYSKLLGNLNLNLSLLLFKIPYFIFDLGLAYLITTLVKDRKDKIYAFSFWLFNPVSLYSTYMMGQFDIIPTFLALLALFFASKNRIYLSSMLLGLGGSFKIFPLLFLLPLSFTKEGIGQRIKIILAGLLTYVVTTFPYIFSSGYRNSALLADHSLKTLYATIPVSGGQSIILFLAAILFCYIVFYYSKNRVEDLWKKFLILLSVFFIFTHYHPQWFVWITPFIVLDIIKSKYKRILLLIPILISYFGLLTFFDPSLTTRIFSPLMPRLNSLTGIWDLIGIRFNLDESRSLLHTIFVAVGMYYVYLYLRKRKEEVSD